MESQLDRGTVFKLYFPAIKMHVADTCNTEYTLPTGNEHILFIDDEVSIVKMGKQNLESLGYTVETLTSSLEALELFKNDPGRFDLVISDMTMPHMTGDILCAAIKKIRSDIPTLLCTGFNINLDDANTKRIGIDAVIYKPVLRPELAKKIRAVLKDSTVNIDSPG